MDKENIIDILMFPFAVFALVLFLFIERMCGRKLEEALGDLFIDNYAVRYYQ